MQTFNSPAGIHQKLFLSPHHPLTLKKHFTLHFTIQSRPNHSQPSISQNKIHNRPDVSFKTSKHAKKEQKNTKQDKTSTHAMSPLSNFKKKKLTTKIRRS